MSVAKSRSCHQAASGCAHMRRTPQSFRQPRPRHCRTPAAVSQDRRVSEQKPLAATAPWPRSRPCTCICMGLPRQGGRHTSADAGRVRTIARSQALAGRSPRSRQCGWRGFPRGPCCTPQSHLHHRTSRPSHGVAGAKLRPCPVRSSPMFLEEPEPARRLRVSSPPSRCEIRALSSTVLTTPAGHRRWLD